jgi:epoxyqueuosine reductase
MEVNMNSILKEEAKKHGDRLQIIPVEHLADLKEELEEFKISEELNGFQKWIINDLYHFEIPDTGFEVKSIILMALYRPFAADIILNYQGKSYYTKSLAWSDCDVAKKYMTDILNQKQYHSYEVGNLPMKRLAVQSGLAVYGRNNITYVEELGSNISYIAFFSDIPCEEDTWRNQCVAKICNHCNACINLCPTGAIRKDRFLIDNQRCLSCINEDGGDFPDWLPKDVHHTLYDCLRCQEKCPLNATVSKDIIGPICVTEEETQRLLEGKGPEYFTPQFMENAKKIGLFNWSQGLPRNIRAIIEAESC